MSYSDKLKDPRWQRKRLEILQRDEFKCRDCGTANKTLHVHHCHYNGADPWDTNDHFLLTLCEDCHKGKGEISRADLEKTGKEALSVIMANTPFDENEKYHLGDFVAQLIEAATAMVRVGGFKPILINEFVLWLYAVNNPEFRQTFEAIAGADWDWESIDKNRKERATISANQDNQA